MDGRASLRELWRIEDPTMPLLVLVSGAGGPMLSEVSLRVVGAEA